MYGVSAVIVHELRGNLAGFRAFLLSIKCLLFFIIYANFARAVILALDFYWYPKALMNEKI